MNSIIITVTDRSSSIKYDLEIPTDQKFGSLRKDMAEALNGCGAGRIVDPEHAAFFSGKLGRDLIDSETAAEAGLWNGDYLIVREAF